MIDPTSLRNDLEALCQTRFTAPIRIEIEPVSDGKVLVGCLGVEAPWREYVAGWESMTAGRVNRAFWRVSTAVSTGRIYRSKNMVKKPREIVCKVNFCKPAVTSSTLVDGFHQVAPAVPRGAARTPGSTRHAE